MQRYFISKQQKQGDHIYITGEDVHHIKNVLRSSLGDALVCCDGEGSDYLSHIEKMSSDKICCRISCGFPSVGEPKTKITIAQSLPKREKYEWILQKGTEIGAVRFLPFVSERSVVKLDVKKVNKKKERWERIVKEAAEQAHRGMVPGVSSLLSWNELLDEIENTKTPLIAYEQGGSSISSLSLSKDVLFIAGPEGGFSEREIDEAKERGAMCTTLGPRILRTETAPLVGLTCILFQNKDMGGE